MKSGKALRFNVMLAYCEDSDNPDAIDGYILVTGFRLMDGNITPPMSKSRTNWFQNTFFSEEVAEIIYDSLEKSLKRKELVDKFPLNSSSTAIKPLLAEEDLGRYIPEKVGKI